VGLTTSRGPAAGPVDANPDRVGGPRRYSGRVGVLAPAFVVAVAYVDPGNFATNMAAGARYGHLLLWVVVAASLGAMFIQYLAAKLGVVTGRSLPELCREHYPRPLTLLLWVQAELVTMATDLAEFVGAAVALYLLFGIPLLPGVILAATVSFVTLTLAPPQRRLFTRIIIGLLAVVLAGFVYQVVELGSFTGATTGLIPRFAGTDSVLLATGMLGATVMPHAIYLHSAVAKRPQGAGGADRRTLRSTAYGLCAALGLAGSVNAAMLLIPAGTLHGITLPAESLADLHGSLGVTLGERAAIAFAVALLASGLAASSVGTYSGQIVMAGFLRRQIPLALRRLVTMIPAIAVVALGLDPTRALVLSQVVLSFGIPFALLPVVLLGRRRSIMGALRNGRATTIAGLAAATMVSGLNVFLIVQVLVG
jgi:manganese transport protein